MLAFLVLFSASVLTHVLLFSRLKKGIASPPSLSPSVHYYTELAGQITSLQHFLFLMTKIPGLPTAKGVIPGGWGHSCSHNPVLNTFLASFFTPFFHALLTHWSSPSPDPSDISNACFILSATFYPEELEGPFPASSPCWTPSLLPRFYPSPQNLLAFVYSPVSKVIVFFFFLIELCPVNIICRRAR